MRFKKDEDRKKMPPHHQIHTIYHEDRRLSINRTILLMDASGFFQMKKEKPLSGAPVYACVYQQHLFVYPTPDKATEIRVRYTPPLKEC